MSDQNDQNAALNNVVELKPQDFAAQFAGAQSVVTKLSKQLARECRRHRLSYDQLKRIFVNVRRECEIEVPRQREKLLELPSDADLRKWFDAIDDPTHRLIMSTLIGGGFRVSELAGVECKHVDLTNNQIFVKNGKGGKDRIVVIGNKLKALLEIHLAGKRQRYLFESSRRTRFSSRRLQQIAEAASAASGIHVHCHSLRHIWNTRLAAQSLNESQRAILAGHSKSTATQMQARYTHLSLNEIRDKAISAVDKYDL